MTCLSTTSLNFFKSAGAVFNLSTSKSSTFVFKIVQTIVYRNTCLGNTIINLVIQQMY